MDCDVPMANSWLTLWEIITLFDVFRITGTSLNSGWAQWHIHRDDGRGRYIFIIISNDNHAGPVVESSV